MHIIHLSQPKENYSSVEAAASHQRCSLICTIKSNGYGHRSVQTAKFLVEMCSSNAFAATTLEEYIMLRRDLNSGFDSTMVK